MEVNAKQDIAFQIEKIIQTFDVKVAKDSLTDQIENYGDTKYGNANLFFPYYSLWNNIKNNEEIEKHDPLLISSTRTKYYEICNTCINAICERYNIYYSAEILSRDEEKLEYVAMYLYFFFILDIDKLVVEVLEKFISINMNKIVEQFSSEKLKRDATTLANKKKLSPEYLIVISKLYTIADWILETIDNESFFDLINGDYVPLSELRSYFDSGLVFGNFTASISAFFKSNMEFRSKIGYFIMAYIERVSTPKKDMGDL